MTTPLEFEGRYHNLLVALDDSSLTAIDIKNYRLRGAASASYNTVDAEKAKDRILEHLNAEIKAELTESKAELKAAGTTGLHGIVLRLGAAIHQSNAEVMKRSKTSIALVHMGKGSPDEIAMTLQLVARYGLYDKHLDVNLGVWKYCRDFIGLDCNGFVGNYAKAMGSSLTPSTYIGSFAPEAKRRTRLEDVKANDVMVWTNYGHITVIDSIDPVITGPDGKPSRDCRVVESTASAALGNGRSGLQNSVYAIRSVDASKKFTIERPKHGGHDHVYIAPLA